MGFLFDQLHTKYGNVYDCVYMYMQTAISFASEMCFVDISVLLHVVAYLLNIEIDNFPSVLVIVPFVTAPYRKPLISI